MITRMYTLENQNMLHADEFVPMEEFSQLQAENKRLEQALSAALANSADDEFLQTIIDVNEEIITGDWDDACIAETGRSLNKHRVQKWILPSSVESFPERLYFKMPAPKRLWDKFRSKKVLSHLKVKDYKFLGEDGNGNAHYLALMDPIRFHNAKDWNAALAAGGRSVGVDRVEITISGMWKMSINGRTFHTEQNRVLALDYWKSQQVEISQD